MLLLILSSEISGSYDVNHAVKRAKTDLSFDHPVVATLREYEEKVKLKKLRKSYNLNEEDEVEVEEEEEKKSSNETIDMEDNDKSSDFIGPLHRPINERVQPTPEQLIYKNRLELNQLLEIEKFKSYKAGKPTKVLYIKNLAKQTTSEDLACLFSRFFVQNQSSVEYKLLQQGRIRGQAFVTFSDLECAVRALNLCNGYMLHGKPMVIQYGRPRSEG
uniref:RRM domain-containing protein n=2 Tax=Clytia hemisphaerica TaxID=252671 RepID=A0A7M6DKN6_9CNID